MKRLFLISGLLFVLTFGGCSKKTNTQGPLPLSDEEIQLAFDYGENNASLTYTEFTEKWAVDLGYDRGKGRAVLITPFLRVALIGKKAARYNEKIDYNLIKKVLQEEAGKFIFEVMLFGDSPKFGRTVKAKLKYKDKEIKPVYSYFPPYSQMSRDYTQIVTGRLKFPVDEIPKNAKITLIVSFIPGEGQKETSSTFVFDLKKFR